MRNAIIAASTDIAEKYISAFDLDTRHWRVFRHGDSPRSYQFDRIVIIRPHWQTSGGEMIDFEGQVKAWMTRLVRCGHLTII
ncbi:MULTISPECIES: hypothetical protein [unclassified Bradyrhizobium]|uniref:hypothetical protein n=1 Tax=unclassified Bradyrhizobium TaxID=2631580 RepID=UPI0028E29A46|nr:MULTISPECIES: hypothetical protein [unclassified Bradyrhizobium]